MFRTRYLTLFAASLTLCAGLSLKMAAADENTLTPAEKAQGWKLLFDGTSLNGWVPAGKKESWRVEDGTIACQGKGGHLLRTAAQYGNYVLSLQFKVTPGTNSGVFLRWSDLSDWLNKSIEVQIYDSFGGGRLGRHECGAIYDCLAPTKIACRPAGVWNKMVITCNDNRITIEHNGVKLTEMDLDQWSSAGKNPDGSANKFKYAYKELGRRGYIALQDHGHKLWFRNIKILSLSEK